MKKILYLAVFSLSFCVVGLLSCKKYLDKKPDNTLSTPETLEDLQALLDYTPAMNVTTPCYLEASADNYFMTQAAYDARFNNQAPYTWRFPFAGFYDNSNDWRDGYTTIYPVNVCLEALAKIPKTNANSAQWNNVKGSALFFRAYTFLNLCWVYAKAYDETTASNDLGIYLKATSNVDEHTFRSSVQASYEKIIADAKEAIQYIPEVSTHPMRPSKAAVYGLLARTYLSMRKYDSALVYSDLCLQLRHELINYNGDPDIVNSIYGNAPPFRRFNKETIFYSEQTTNSFNTATDGFIDTLLYTAYDSRDLRKAAFFRPQNSYQAFKGTYGSGTFEAVFSGITTAEMYLTRAECYARLNDKNSALTDLNTLLINRWQTGFFTPVSAATANDALNIILAERRKELLYRGLRWTDIKRLNKEGKNIILTRFISGQTYTLQPNDNRYALPIPQFIIDISGIAQNPGW
jgi:hypothetical protein